MQLTPGKRLKPARGGHRLTSKKLDHGKGIKHARARSPKPLARPTLCTLVDDNFAERVRARCEAEGITVSSLVHELVSEWLDGTRPTEDEIYKRARALAIKYVHQALMSAPTSYSQAIAPFRK